MRDSLSNKETLGVFILGNIKSINDTPDFILETISSLEKDFLDLIEEENKINNYVYNISKESIKKIIKYKITNLIKLKEQIDINSNVLINLNFVEFFINKIIKSIQLKVLSKTNLNYLVILNKDEKIFLDKLISELNLINVNFIDEIYFDFSLFEELE